jgi:hypothetical protein
MMNLIDVTRHITWLIVSRSQSLRKVELPPEIGIPGPGISAANLRGRPDGLGHVS